MTYGVKYPTIKQDPMKRNIGAIVSKSSIVVPPDEFPIIF